jgi:bifunctional non-homologous end joining protein LigD
MRLSRRSEPFDSDQFIYELKIDGFRALAHIQDQQGELVSRKGNAFRGFAELATWIAEHLRVESAVLDGEIWIKVKNSRYSQLEGGEEFFER